MLNGHKLKCRLVWRKWPNFDEATANFECALTFFVFVVTRMVEFIAHTREMNELCQGFQQTKVKAKKRQLYHYAPIVMFS